MIGGRRRGWVREFVAGAAQARISRGWRRIGSAGGIEFAGVGGDGASRASLAPERMFSALRTQILTGNRRRS